MRKYLIRLLNGIPAEDAELALKSLEVRLNALHSREMDIYRDLLANTQKDNEYLRSLLFKEHGIIHDEVPVQENKEFKPIQNTREAWPRRRARLEAEDAKNLRETLEKEAHWLAKGAVHVGGNDANQE